MTLPQIFIPAQPSRRFATPPRRVAADAWPDLQKRCSGSPRKRCSRQARVSVVPVVRVSAVPVGPCKRSAAGQIAEAYALPVIRTSSGAEIKWFSDCAGFRRVAADAWPDLQKRCSGSPRNRCSRQVRASAVPGRSG